jgi:Cu2+-exporting ATPase
MHHGTHDHDHGPAPSLAAPASDAHAAHDKHAGHDPYVFRGQFWIVLALTIPVVAWSREVQDWLGYVAPAFPGSSYIPAALGTIVFLYGGRVFLTGARTELGDRQPGMMTLISLAITVAFMASAAATLGLFAVELWWELSTLITVMSRRRDDKVLAAWRRFSGATPADVPAPLRRMVELAVATAASAGD